VVLYVANVERRSYSDLAVQTMTLAQRRHAKGALLSDCEAAVDVAQVTPVLGLYGEAGVDG
jgi:hypothetical protein